MATRSKLPSRLQDDIKDVLEHAGEELRVDQIMLGLKGRYNLLSIRNRLGRMVSDQLIERITDKSGNPVRYRVKPKVRYEMYIKEWRPLIPARNTVVPVRERGRMAPDVSDGFFVSMTSRVDYARKMEI